MAPLDQVTSIYLRHPDSSVPAMPATTRSNRLVRGVRFGAVVSVRRVVVPRCGLRSYGAVWCSAAFSVLAAALLTDELGRAVVPADLGWDAGDVELVSAISGLVLPWTVAGSLRAVRVVTDAVSMERRIFLTLLGTAATAHAHEWLSPIPRTPPPSPVPLLARWCR